MSKTVTELLAALASLPHNEEDKTPIEGDDDLDLEEEAA